MRKEKRKGKVKERKERGRYRGEWEGREEGRLRKEWWHKETEKRKGTEKNRGIRYTLYYMVSTQIIWISSSLKTRFE